MQKLRTELLLFVGSLLIIAAGVLAWLVGWPPRPSVDEAARKLDAIAVRVDQQDREIAALYASLEKQRAINLDFAQSLAERQSRFAKELAGIVEEGNARLLKRFDHLLEKRP